MAFASYTPTQMGSTVSLPTSFSTTIGMLVTGSIINPRIFISTSIAFSPMTALSDHDAQQTVRETPGYKNVNITAHGRHGLFWRGKVQGYVLRRAANYLASRLIYAFNHYFKCLSHSLLVVDSLDFPLPFLQ